ncbi:MAG: NADH-quinone oxidoreductase subunit NuoE [Proteobacteria bacterium]|nr:MAG: NADH-quinone oxidoreductase subunit NuoE [Pseudomonadota bacterium]
MSAPATTEKKFTEAFYKEMERIQGFYPNKAALLLPALHAAQAERGWISDTTMEEISAYLSVPKTRVKEVVTFYHMFHTKPVGKFNLQFCNNIACWLRGSEELIHHAEKKCGISLGETTKDGRFTISEVECLGSCGTAPVCQVNEDYHENLDAKSIDRLLEELR